MSDDHNRQHRKWSLASRKDSAAMSGQLTTTVETQIADALASNSAEGMSREAFTELQRRTKADGRCGVAGRLTGLPCRIRPATGFVVCRKHGGRNPQSLQKAERLLAVARIPAIESVLDFLDQYASHKCPECGFPVHDTDEKRTMLAASKLVLDRTGLGPKATLQVNASKTDDTDQLIEHMTQEERTEVAGLVRRLDEIKTAVRLRLAQANAGAMLVANGGTLDASFTSEPAE